jgi:RNA polymerase sigma-70 factor (ECF subfamily)
VRNVEELFTTLGLVVANAFTPAAGSCRWGVVRRPPCAQRFTAICFQPCVRLANEDGLAAVNRTRPDVSAQPTDQTQPSGPGLARWFSDEVQSHEPALRSYVRGSFPALRDVDDVVQESYLRLWRARVARPVASSKAFLFAIARNVARDLARRTRRSPINPLVDLAGVQVVEDSPSVADLLGEKEKVDMLGRAVSSLPSRCREIIVLHKIRGLAQREVATRLGVSEKTVENQVAIGVKRCEEFFHRHGIDRF